MPAPPTYTRILCPVDFSDTSRAAFARALVYASRFGSELLLLHIREGHDGNTDELDDTEKTLLARLEALRADHLEEGSSDVKIRLLVGAGKPWMEIIRLATEQKCELIVMGTHGYTGFRHIMIGSQAERVVRRAPCDVLCVKPSDYEDDGAPG